MSVVEELKASVRKEMDALLEAKAQEQRLLRFLKDQVIQMLIYDQDKISELTNSADIKFALSGHEHKSIQINYHSGTRLYLSLHTTTQSRNDALYEDLQEAPDLKPEHGCIKCWKPIITIDNGDNGIRYCGCTSKKPVGCL